MPALTNKENFTDKMERFCQEYLTDLNATQAAIRAGYSKHTANEQGSRLLAKLSIKSRISELARQSASAAEITPELVLTTIKDTMQRCRQESIPVIVNGKQLTRLDDGGNEQPVYKIDSQGVYRGAELLGRYLALFTDRTEHTGDIGLSTTKISVSMDPEEAARIYRELITR